MPSKRMVELLRGDENERVEFKSTPDAVNMDDIIAFANSPVGGTILVGVTGKHVGGRQVGDVCGCDVSDGAKLKLMNKAAGCVPPVLIKVFVEKYGSLSCFRIEIASSNFRPHGTASGLYKIRVDGRIQPLHRDALLSMFLERESGVFVERFRAAARDLEGAIAKTSEDIITHVGMVVGELSGLDDSLEVIKQSAEIAEDASQNAASYIEEVLANTEQIMAELDNHQDSSVHLHQKMDALLNERSLEDPRIANAKAWLNRTIWMMMGIKDMKSARLDKKSREKVAIMFGELGSKEQVAALIDAAVSTFNSEEAQQYSRLVEKRPALPKHDIRPNSPNRSPDTHGSKLPARRRRSRKRSD